MEEYNEFDLTQKARAGNYFGSNFLAQGLPLQKLTAAHPINLTDSSLSSRSSGFQQPNPEKKIL